MTPSGRIEAAFKGRLGDFQLDIAFDIPASGVTVLFGPSGCGKTTVLRCVAGLEHMGGRLVVDGETWQDARTFVAPHRRPVGYVFQEASLLAHLSVRRNLLFGFRRARGVKPVALDQVTALLGLDPLLERGVARLSGGERQRVAIGRALLSQPRLLLMDEPLAALDLQRKAEVLPYLERLHDELEVPILYV
ncbi:MAG: ATP-binding cassette domain-containing protein, partial [Phenylobacterium sp.]|uniref:molybdenum ABC transporter ATP-binding protein n=1 Tax=Phenylobacterium sp. TaxID=1871053 RepID=UPI0027345BD8